MFNEYRMRIYQFFYIQKSSSLSLYWKYELRFLNMIPMHTRRSAQKNAFFLQTMIYIWREIFSIIKLRICFIPVYGMGETYYGTASKHFRDSVRARVRKNFLYLVFMHPHAYLYFSANKHYLFPVSFLDKSLSSGLAPTCTRRVSLLIARESLEETWFKSRNFFCRWVCLLKLVCCNSTHSYRICYIEHLSYSRRLIPQGSSSFL